MYQAKIIADIRSKNTRHRLTTMLVRDEEDPDDRTGYLEDAFGWSRNFRGFVQYRQTVEEK